METYRKIAPLLTSLLWKNMNLTYTRHHFYKRDETRCTIQQQFDWPSYKQMNHHDSLEAKKIIEDFPYFSELPEPEKVRLFKRFWATYSIIERVIDTLGNLDKSINGNFIMLQNCQVFDIGAQLTQDLSIYTPRCATVHKVIFNTWNQLLPLMKQINPDSLELMFIFCCVLWNIFYLEEPLCKDSEDLVRHGRFVIYMEMRRHYKYDNYRTHRLHALKDVIQIAENAVKEYTKVL